MIKQPRFIVVDGPDGAGKTTLIDHLRHQLLALGHKVKIGRGLGSGVAAESIRNTMFKGSEKVSTTYEIHGALMCLIDCYETFVAPILKNDNETIVILDRYISTYYAYQACARESSLAEIMLYDAFIENETIQPDVYLHCNVDIPIAERRLKDRDDNNYFDAEKIEFRNKTKLGFDNFFSQNTRFNFFNRDTTNVVEINCNLELDKVIEQITEFAFSRFEHV